MEAGSFVSTHPFEGATSIRYYIHATLAKQTSNVGNASTKDCASVQTKTDADVKCHHVIAPMFGRGLAGADPSRPVPTPASAHSAMPLAASYHRFNGSPITGFFGHSGRRYSSKGKGRHGGVHNEHGRQGCNASALHAVGGNGYEQLSNGDASYRQGRSGYSSHQDSKASNSTAWYQKGHHGHNRTRRMAARGHGHEERDGTCQATTRGRRTNSNVPDNNVWHKTRHEQCTVNDQKTACGTSPHTGLRPNVSHRHSGQSSHVAHRRASYRNGRQERKATDQKAAFGNASQGSSDTRPYAPRRKSGQKPYVANRHVDHQHHTSDWNAPQPRSHLVSTAPFSQASRTNVYQQFTAAGRRAVRHKSEQNVGYPDRRQKRFSEKPFHE